MSDAGKKTNSEDLRVAKLFLHYLCIAKSALLHAQPSDNYRPGEWDGHLLEKLRECSQYIGHKFPPVWVVKSKRVVSAELEGNDPVQNPSAKSVTVVSVVLAYPELCGGNEPSFTVVAESKPRMSPRVVAREGYKPITVAPVFWKRISAKGMQRLRRDAKAVLDAWIKDTEEYIEDIVS